MGLMPSVLRLLIKVHQQRCFEGPVCSLGNQEIWATHSDLGRFFASSGVRAFTPKRIERHTSRTFGSSPELAALAKDFVHARTFFATLGIEGYEDIDCFDWDRPSRIHDFNLPIPPELRHQFSLVLDGGTIEHIFDVRTALSNVVQMLRSGGQIIHICSFEPDHGFYAFSPCLFFDYYRENGFGDFECYLMRFDYRDVLRTFGRASPYIRYIYGMPIADFFKGEGTTLVLFFGRKVCEVEPVIIPTQGVYKPVAAAEERTSVDSTDRKSRSPESALSARRTRVPGPVKTLLSPLRPIVRAVWVRLRSSPETVANRVEWI